MIWCDLCARVNLKNGVSCVSVRVFVLSLVVSGLQLRGKLLCGSPQSPDGDVN